MPDAPAGPAYVYRARCARVIDGDTFVATVELGFNVSSAVTVRLHGVNAPEHNKPGGPEATAYLQGLLMPINRQTVLEPVPLLLASYRDAMSFARWVCDVWVAPPAGVAYSVARAIIDEGHGVPFMAGP